MNISPDDLALFDLGYAAYNITFDSRDNIESAFIIELNDRYREISGLDLEAGDAIDLTGDNWIPRLKLYKERARCLRS